MKKSIVTYTKPLQTKTIFTIEPTDGKKTISKAKALFSAYIDKDFQGFGCNVVSKPTENQPFVIREMIHDGDFRKIFSGRRITKDLDRLCLTQSQIIAFVEKYPNSFRKDGYESFFLFKIKDKFFVASVVWRSNGFEALVFRFTFDHVWSASFRRRIVIPHI